MGALLKFTNEPFSEPETFEEWVEVFGDPEYIEDVYSSNKDFDQNIYIKFKEKEVKKPNDINLIRQSIKINDDGSKRLNYTAFVSAYAENHPLVHINGQFLTPNGAISEMNVRSSVNKILMTAKWDKALDTPVRSLTNSIKDYTHTDNYDFVETRIPFANGDLYIHKANSEDNPWEFNLNEKAYTPYRLSVDLVEKGSPRPWFNKWLNDVFEEDDIDTIQEMLGYAMLPTTKIQEAFFIVGEGGVGKSVIGSLLNAIFGNAFKAINTQKLVEERFGLSVAENKLVCYDDDLGQIALKETGTLKKLVAADSPVNAERKYQDEYEFLPYCKLIACTNFMLTSLYDDSDGFFRRLHPIITKPKDPKRKIIKGFAEKVVSEKESITKWALQGLKRLIYNNYQITWSKKSRDYMDSMKDRTVNASEFFIEALEYHPTYECAGSELKAAYEKWCNENALVPRGNITNNLKEYAEKKSLEITYSKHIKRNSKQVRGFIGCRIKREWER